MLDVTSLQDVVVNPNRVITVGTFDGVHRGHQVLIDYTVTKAHERGAEAVVVSFDPHPREVVTGTPMPLLTTLEERARALASLGVNQFVVIPFDRQFMELSASDFVLQVLRQQIGMCGFVMGYDHAFGRGREGNPTLMKTLGTSHGFDVEVVPARVIDSVVVSSSELRRALTGVGDVVHAAKLLGRPYSFDATVVQGDQRGRTIGFPTANLALVNAQKIVPRRGVYAVEVHRLATGEQLGGMMNIGYRPTFDGQEHRIEVNLFDFDANIYGEQLRVAFVERVREEMKFEGIEALVRQLSLDEERCRAAIPYISN